MNYEADGIMGFQLGWGRFLWPPNLPDTSHDSTPQRTALHCGMRPYLPLIFSPLPPDQDRVLLWRETSSGISIGAFFISQNVIDMAWVLLSPAIFLGPYYCLTLPVRDAGSRRGHPQAIGGAIPHITMLIPLSCSPNKHPSGINMLILSPPLPCPALASSLSLPLPIAPALLHLLRAGHERVLVDVRHGLPGIGAAPATGGAHEWSVCGAHLWGLLAGERIECVCAGGGRAMGIRQSHLSHLSRHVSEAFLVV